jgi:hypothetical protein
VILPFFWAYIRQPASIYPIHPRTNPWNFWEKYWKFGRVGKWHFVDFWLLDFFPSENQLGFHMRHYLFMQYGWFLQNLEEDFIQTNMHTTVTLRPNIIKAIAIEEKPVRMYEWLKNVSEHKGSMYYYKSHGISLLCYGQCYIISSV